jgi:RNA polymerase sigma factor (sigma-70 family)
VIRKVHKLAEVAAPPARDAGDAELLAGIAGGNLEGLGVLYDRHERDVRRLIHRLGTPAADIDDVVQSVFVEVLRAAAGFDGRASARAWLLGIAAICVRRHRRSAARLLRQLGEWLGRGEQTPETPAETFALVEANTRLQRALMTLSAPKREVFLLVVAEGLSAEHVAASLGIPIATVWTRLHYARQEIRKHLGTGESPEGGAS